MPKKLLIFVTTLVLVQIVAAAEPAILSGYGKTEWGQSLEEVQAILPDGVVDGDATLEAQYVVEGDGAVVKTTYNFIGGELFAVYVAFELPSRPETGPDKEGAMVLRAKIEKKYYSTEESRPLLRAAGVQVNVNPVSTGRIVVVYMNRKVRRAGAERLAAAKQAAAAAAREEALKGGRAQEIDAAGVDDAL